MNVDYQSAFYASLGVNLIQYLRFQYFKKSVIKELGVYMKRVDERFSLQQTEIDSLKSKLKALKGK